MQVQVSVSVSHHGSAVPPFLPLVLTFEGWRGRLDGGEVGHRGVWPRAGLVAGTDAQPVLSVLLQPHHLVALACPTVHLVEPVWGMVR